MLFQSTHSKQKHETKFNWESNQDFTHFSLDADEVRLLVSAVSDPFKQMDDVSPEALADRAAKTELLEQHVIRDVARLVLDFAKDPNFGNLGVKGLLFADTPFVLLRGDAGHNAICIHRLSSSRCAANCHSPMGDGVYKHGLLLYLTARTLLVGVTQDHSHLAGANCAMASMAQHLKDCKF